MVGLAGYAGFVAFTRTDRAAGVGMLALAAATGFAAFFSPCSFPLMLTFLTRQATSSRVTAVASALFVAVGAASLLALVAAVLAAGGQAIAGMVALGTISGRVFRLGIGALLIAFGLRQTQLIRVRMRWLDLVGATASRRLDPVRVSSRFGRDFAYGFGYLLAGFG